jgi:hypothetical protein
VNEFEREVGVGYLCGMHLNDSKKDRHKNLGMYVLIFPHNLAADLHAMTLQSNLSKYRRGHLKLQAFEYIVSRESAGKWTEEMWAAVTVANQTSDARKAAKDVRAKARTAKAETKPRTKAAVGGPVQEAAGTIAKRNRQEKGNVQGGAMKRLHEGDEDSELSELSLDGT